MAGLGAVAEFGSVHIEQVLELDEEDDEDEVAAGGVVCGEVEDMEEDADEELEDGECGRSGLGPAASGGGPGQGGRRSVHKQDATIQMVKWTSAAITTRKKVLKEVDEDEPAGLDSFEEDYLKNLLTIQEFEHKFAQLARRWRRFMNFYGLLQDVTLLLVDAKQPQPRSQQAQAAAAAAAAATRRDHKNNGESSGSSDRAARRLRRQRRVNFTDSQRRGRANATGGARWRRALQPDGLEKLFWLLMIAGANLITIYMLVAHFAWELRRLDATISTAVASIANDTAAAVAAAAADAAGGAQPPKLLSPAALAPATFNGWSLLKNFLENLRRHLSRFFALVLIFIWHKNCHAFELLFVDCRRYYAAFYPKLSSLGMSELWTTGGHGLGGTGGCGGGDGGCDGQRAEEQSERAVAVRKIRVILTIREHQLQLIEATSRFYDLARRRINLAVWLPFAHLAFNIAGIFLAPNALILANNGQQAGGNGGGIRPQDKVDNTSSLAASRLMQNFETFHLAVHTAFHPYEHQINATSGNSTPAAWSAFYCLAELFGHYVYIGGPRIVCATCLSLVLAIHHQCLRAFNKHLTRLIRRGREWPLSRWDMVKLLKQYDMIGMMHERIEATFKWSLVSWFALMFISCLMLIFTLTESTSAAFGISAPGSEAPATPTSAQGGVAAAASPATAASVLETVCPVALLLARILYVCYAPIMIYAEAFNIESENSRATQLIMLLARRQDDPVAQAIEPSLFGPLQLSAGGFFKLSKKSVAPLLGAIVTFSIMFIGSASGHEQPSALLPDADDQPEVGGGGGASETDETQDAGGDARPTADELDEPEESLDDAAAAPGARLVAPRLVFASNQRKPMLGGQTAKTASGRPGLSAPAGEEHQSESKARQWRKFRRLNRKFEATAAPPRQLTISHARPHGPRAPLADNQIERPEGASVAAAANAAAAARPRLAPHYLARLRENERQLSFVPKLRVENQIEICDFELLAQKGDEAAETAETSRQQSLFAVTWIDRIGGEVAVEATNLTLINCERQRNYTLGMRAIACNGLESNEALLRIELEDVNEFSPEFERGHYAVTLDAHELRHTAAGQARPQSQSDTGPTSATAAAAGWCHLLKVRAHDQDCSRELGQVCRYELLLVSPGGVDSRHSEAGGAGSAGEPSNSELAANVRVDARGDLQARCSWLLDQVADSQQQGSSPVQASASFLFQVVAFDCGGKKSQRPARIQVDIRGPQVTATPPQPPQQQQHHDGLRTRETGATSSKLNDSAPSGDATMTCRPSWKDVDTQIAYRPSSGERWPFLRAKLDLCSIKCHRPLNITVKLQLEATPPSSSARQQHSSAVQDADASSIRRNANQQLQQQQHQQQPPVFHCDRDPYAMVSKRRLCGARRKTLELLPPLSAHTQWMGPLVWGRRGHHRQQRRRHEQHSRSKVAPPAGNATDDESSGEAQSAPSAALQADELRPRAGALDPDDAEEEEEEEQEEGQEEEQGDEEGEEAGEREEEDSEEAGLTDDERHHAPPLARPPGEEENLGAYLPDGSYGQLAREFAARERQSGRLAADQQQPKRRSARASGAQKLLTNQQQQQQQERRGSARVRKSAIYRDQVYHFDGVSDALLVPSHVYSSEGDAADLSQRANGTLFGARHTLSFWMRHSEFKFQQQQQQRNQSAGSATAEELQELSRHVREHLLCVSERRHSPSNHLNPHLRQHPHQHHSPKHYAVYLRNCKLNLLMRQADGEPAPHEWRWSLDATGQFCDNKWHLYTINVQHQQQVELYVDGQQFDTEKKVTPGATLNADPEAPPSAGSQQAHASAQVLTLGACWDARSRSMVGHFRGALSGLNVLAGANDEPSAIECLGRCTEALVSSAFQNDQQKASQEARDNSLVSYQEAQDRIQLRGHDPLDVEDALAQIAYVNRRQLPSIGRRTISLDTSLSCAVSTTSTTGATTTTTTTTTTTSALPISTLKVEVSVLPSTSLPVISLTGTPNLAREHLPFREGRVAPFESVKLRVKQVSLLGADWEVSERQQQQQQQRVVSGRMMLKSSQQLTADLLDYIDDATLNLHHNNQQQQQQQHLERLKRPSGGATGAGVNLDASENLANTRGRIESCHIRVSPPLDGAHEALVMPVEQLERLELYWRQSSAGAVIYGLDSAENYEALLRLVRYRNERPGDYEERLLQLACSDMSGRLLSNEHLQRLTVIHPRPPAFAGGQQLVLGDEPRATSAVNETNNFFSSLRHSPGPHLALPSEQVAPLDGPTATTSNKLDRIAMAFLVFVVSLILIVLVIALTNLRDTATGATCKRAGADRRNRRAHGRRSLDTVARDCQMAEMGSVADGGGHQLVRRRHHPCAAPAPCTDAAQLHEMARADCYFAHDELTEHESSSYTSYEEEEEDEYDGNLGERADAFSEDATRMYDSQGKIVHGSHRCRAGLAGSPPSSVDLDSLSWDDELTNHHHQHQESTLCRFHSHHYHAPPVATTIVINPLVHGSELPALSEAGPATAEADTALAVARRRTLVASLKPGAENDTQAHSHLVLDPSKIANEEEDDDDDDDDEEEVDEEEEPEVEELESEADSRAEESAKTAASAAANARNDLLALDEDMTSVCSRSCSTSSLASLAQAHDSEDADPEPELYHHHACRARGAHLRARQRRRQRSPVCLHQTEDDDMGATTSAVEDEELEEYADDQQPRAYEIYHAHHHHHRCLRAPLVGRECAGSARVSNSEASSSGASEPENTFTAALTASPNSVWSLAASDSAKTNTLKNCDNWSQERAPLERDSGSGSGGGGGRFQA